MASDGSVLIEFNANATPAERELAKLKEKIEDAEKTLEVKKGAQSSLSNELKSAKEAAQSTELSIKEINERIAELRKIGDLAGIESPIGLNRELASLKEQEKILNSQNVEVQRLDVKYAKITDEVIKATGEISKMRDRAGGLQEQIDATGTASYRMGEAMDRAGAYVDKFTSRVKKLMSRVFVFTMITSALRGMRTWLGNVIKTNDEATAAIAKLKGALLTLAQPLVDVVIPAFVALVNVLTKIVSIISALMSRLFGTTAKKSAEAAKKLNAEAKALEGVGSAAKEAEGSLAGFDEINTIQTENTGGGAGNSNAEILPDFSEAGDLSWLKETLGSAAGWVTAALLLGGIALVAIGACTGNLGLVLAGLLALGAGIVIGNETGVFQSWVDTLGLSSVGEFVTIALLLGGIALVAIGACTGNILTVLAGLGLLGVGLAIGSENGTLGSWAEKLGLESVGEFVTSALLLGGIALVALGAILGNAPLVIAGLGLLAAGVVVGIESGTLVSWAETLGLDSVFEYVAVGMQLGGIALAAIGAAMGNAVMVIAGLVLLGAGLTAELIGEENLKDWWEKLKLTNVRQWVSVALQLGGIALVAIGAIFGNILMLVAGLGLIGFSAVTSTGEGNLKDWATVLGLNKVMGWVTAGLMLAGLALVVFGIVTANIAMVLAGVGLLGAGVTVGVSSGTFGAWIEKIVTGLKSLVKSIKEDVIKPIEDAFKKFYNSAVGIVEGVVNGFIGVINAFIRGINSVIGTINKIPGVNLGKISTIQTVSIPRLAQGAVIPPNREFMAVLGDQKSGTNVEAPLETIKQALIEALRESGGGNNRPINITMMLDRKVIGKAAINEIRDSITINGKIPFRA